MFHEVSGNSYSIAAIFGEDTDDFNKPKIIGLDQSFLNLLALALYLFQPWYRIEPNLMYARFPPMSARTWCFLKHHDQDAWKYL